MITEQFIWFIDSRFYYQTTSLDKLVHLIPPHQKTLKIIIDASAQLKGRGYWHLFTEKDTLLEQLMAKLELKKAQLIKFFDMNAINVEIVINQSADYLKVINSSIKLNPNSLLVIEDNALEKRHSIFQKLTEIDSPILLLNHKAWNDSIKLVAAVDPLHEQAKAGNIDDHIIALTNTWSRLLKAESVVVHCYYVTSMLAKYKNKILTMHRDGLANFAKKHRIAASKCVLLEGVPEVALTSYIAKNNSQILVMGMVTRNKLAQLWIGSTTTALLSKLPCDILLLKK